jgi:hypothetical protein
MGVIRVDADARPYTAISPPSEKGTLRLLIKEYKVCLLPQLTLAPAESIGRKTYLVHELLDSRTVDHVVQRPYSQVQVRSQLV